MLRPKQQGIPIDIYIPGQPIIPDQKILPPSKSGGVSLLQTTFQQVQPNLIHPTLQPTQTTQPINLFPTIIRPVVPQKSTTPLQPNIIQSSFLQPTIQPGVIQPGVIQPGIIQPSIVQSSFPRPIIQPSIIQPAPLQPTINPSLQPVSLAGGLIQPILPLPTQLSQPSNISPTAVSTIYPISIRSSLASPTRGIVLSPRTTIATSVSVPIPKMYTPEEAFALAKLPTIPPIISK